MKSEKIVVVVEPIYYHAIREEFKFETKYENTVPIEIIDNVLNTYKPIKEVIKTIQIFKNTVSDKIPFVIRNNSSTRLYSLLDTLNFKYSKVELELLGLDHNFSSGLMYSMLKNDFESKYTSQDIIKQIKFDENLVTEQIAKFNIALSTLNLDKITHNSYTYCLKLLFNEFDETFENFLDDIKKVEKKDLEILLPNLKGLRKLVRKYRKSVKNKKANLLKIKNSHLGNEFNSIEMIERLKLVYTEYINLLDEDYKILTENLDNFNKFIEHIEKGIIDKQFFTKLKKFIPFSKATVESPGGYKFSLEN
jgi:hypothetical protein